MSTENWEYDLENILLLTEMPSYTEYMKYSSEKNINYHSLFEKLTTHCLKNFSSPEKYLGLNQSDITYKKSSSPFTFKVVGKYSGNGPIIVSAYIVGNWKVRSGLPIPKLNEAETDMHKFVELLRIATLGLSSKNMCEALKTNFKWADANDGFPFEGRINLSHEIYNESLDEFQLNYIPTKIRVDSGPVFSAEFLVRKWQ